jgi:hypothetical protein
LPDEITGTFDDEDIQVWIWDDELGKYINDGPIEIYFEWPQWRAEDEGATYYGPADGNNPTGTYTSTTNGSFTVTH